MHCIQSRMLQGAVSTFCLQAFLQRHLRILSRATSRWNEHYLARHSRKPCSLLLQNHRRLKPTSIKLCFSSSSQRMRLERAWQSMCRRHGILRTCFISTDDHRHPFVQVVLKDRLYTWHSIDIIDSSIDYAVDQQLETLPGAVDSLCPPISFCDSAARTQIVPLNHLPPQPSTTERQYLIC